MIFLKVSFNYVKNRWKHTLLKEIVSQVSCLILMRSGTQTGTKNNEKDRRDRISVIQAAVPRIH